MTESTKPFTGVQLRVNNPTRLARFYVEKLGMHRLIDNKHTSLSFADGGVLQLVATRQTNKYEASRGDRYWKIGITVPDLDLAVRQLTAKAVAVSTPQQFLNIGYLSHLQDPEGFSVELIQHTFAEQPPDVRAIDSSLLGGGARLAHITLRTHDIASDLGYFRDELGMRLLSRQPVPEYDFELYFLAHSHEQPPEAELDSIANRPWLWQRPYPLLELQSFKRNSKLHVPQENEPGFAGLIFQPPGDD